MSLFPQKNPNRLFMEAQICMPCYCFLTAKQNGNYGSLDQYALLPFSDC